jgi:hypothetical protein
MNLAMFTDDYAKTLQKAPKIFRAGDMVSRDDLPVSAASWVESPGMLGSQECPDADLPNEPGKVVKHLQLVKGGSGHITVRWGEWGNGHKAEYHFAHNPAVQSKPLPIAFLD